MSRKTGESLQTPEGDRLFYEFPDDAKLGAIINELLRPFPSEELGIANEIVHSTDNTNGDHTTKPHIPNHIRHACDHTGALWQDAGEHRQGVTLSNRPHTDHGAGARATRRRRVQLHGSLS
jgi:hypothetical protein